jgi:outer membrane protein insertion porin family
MHYLIAKHDLKRASGAYMISTQFDKAIKLFVISILFFNPIFLPIAAEEQMPGEMAHAEKLADKPVEDTTKTLQEISNDEIPAAPESDIVSEEVNADEDLSLRDTPQADSEHAELVKDEITESSVDSSAAGEAELEISSDPQTNSLIESIPSDDLGYEAGVEIYSDVEAEVDKAQPSEDSGYDADTEFSSETEESLIDDSGYEADTEYSSDEKSEEIEPEEYLGPRSIKEIVIHGNEKVTDEAIRTKLPYYIDQIYTPVFAAGLIRNLMNTNLFSKVQLFGQKVAPDDIILHVVVKEKKLLKEFNFEGNKHLSPKEIEKKLQISDIHAVDEFDVKGLERKIAKLYAEKDYHNALVEGEMTDVDGKAEVKFTVKENKKSIVKRVFFTGNTAFSAKELKTKIFTREDWALGFMDSAGRYQPDAIESDKHTLEDFYQSNGYLMAKVGEVDVEHVPGTNYVNITFHISEGDKYTISEISAPGNDLVPEETLLAILPIRVGDLYSKEKIRDAIELLRTLWGEHGYFYADVEPSIEPDEDTKTVKLAFFNELGEKVYLKNITIEGNEKTRDKVVRRQLLFDEGDLLTTKKIEDSKERVLSLGYFDQKDGMSWKIRRADKESVDLDMKVNEVKTGRVDVQMGFGGSPKDLQNPTQSLRLGGSITDTNLFGRGIGFHLNGEVSKQERQVMFNITQPWLFDRPIYGAMDFSIKRSIYEEFRFTEDDVKEKLITASGSIGYIASWLNFTKLVAQVGGENIRYTSKPEVNLSEIRDPKQRQEFAGILSSRFMQGTFPWIGLQAAQDCRNHPIHPSRGYQFLVQTKGGIPNNDFGFGKVDIDMSYYTPVIGERDLVFYFHTHLGLVHNYGNNTIPFRELYHIGGPASVRGFLFGEIGPMYRPTVSATGDSIGARKAFWLNTELIFPISPDFSIKGVVFYDGGAGWDTPNSAQISPKRLTGNSFSYRHSVGFGFRIYRPTPIKVDWGFKLDRRKGERESEVHLTMSHDF